MWYVLCLIFFFLVTDNYMCYRWPSVNDICVNRRKVYHKTSVIHFWWNTWTPVYIAEYDIWYIEWCKMGSNMKIVWQGNISLFQFKLMYHLLKRQFNISLYMHRNGPACDYNNWNIYLLILTNTQLSTYFCKCFNCLILFVQML